MGKHCWKPVPYCSVGYNHYPNSVTSDEFRYGCKTTRWKRIYFTRFQTEIKSIHCNAIWAWHLREIFVYLLIETSGKQINLWV